VSVKLDPTLTTSYLCPFRIGQMKILAILWIETDYLVYILLVWLLCLDVKYKYTNQVLKKCYFKIPRELGSDVKTIVCAFNL
jgi:hypothetical protein